MIKPLISLAAALALTTPAIAQDAEPQGEPSPNQIVSEAPASDWIAIAPEDLLVMTLAPDAQGNERQVVMQLMPALFSQGWVENIRTLARAHWYDGISVVRVQDNYVVQWGDPDGEDADKAKPLPEGLRVMGEEEYESSSSRHDLLAEMADRSYETLEQSRQNLGEINCSYSVTDLEWLDTVSMPEPEGVTCNELIYSDYDTFDSGWPIATNWESVWPVHCYGMVGVGRSYSPDTGTGAELYTVIGHAPRHLDRNIALVGRVIEGIEHLSSLPRGKGDLGFYEDASKRVPIASIRVAADLPAGEQPQFQYLSTTSEPFAKYADARANRRDPFFIVPAGGADICNIPVPVRRVSGGE